MNNVLLPLGDSITSNGFGYYSYRYYLWRLLVLEGIHDFDFVGTLQDNYNGNPDSWPSINGTEFDRDHEGRWGWRIDQVLQQLDNWVGSYNAISTIALIHLGTNDCGSGETVQGILEELQQVVDKLQGYNPSMQVFLAKLIPSKFPRFQECLDSLNAELDNLASPSRVHVVDMAQDFNVTTDLWDNLHPNNQGSEKMANTWFQAMQNAGALSAPTAPPSQTSISGAPTFTPTSVPSTNTVPTFTPTFDGSVAVPTSTLIFEPRASTVPSSIPTSEPSISAAPTFTPTSKPTTIAVPTFSPTSASRTPFTTAPLLVLVVLLLTFVNSNNLQRH